MSGRVISSGYIPPVSSKSARRSKLSELQEFISMDGKDHDIKLLTCQIVPPLLANTKQDQQQPC